MPEVAVIQSQNINAHAVSQQAFQFVGPLLDQVLRVDGRSGRSFTFEFHSEVIDRDEVGFLRAGESIRMEVFIYWQKWGRQVADGANLLKKTLLNQPFKTSQSRVLDFKRRPSCRQNSSRFSI